MNGNVGIVANYSLEENKKINNVGIACYAIPDHKAITLVALIITIVVMLILAGVTLSIAFAENGIFSQSKLAVQEYENARIREEQELQSASNELLNLGIASSRDEQIMVNRDEYEELKEDVKKLKANQGIKKTLLWDEGKSTTGEIILSDSIQNYDMVSVLGQYYEVKSDSSEHYQQAQYINIFKEDYNISTSVEGATFLINDTLKDVTRRVTFSFSANNKIQIGNIEKMKILKVYGINFY